MTNLKLHVIDMLKDNEGKTYEDAADEIVTFINRHVEDETYELQKQIRKLQSNEA